MIDARLMDTQAPVPLGNLTRQGFEPHVGTAFSLTSPVVDSSTGMINEQTFALKLTAVRPGVRPSATWKGREPFSLFFDGPADISLPQRIWPLVHPEIGLLEIFLVPLSADSDKRVYQAAFN